MKQGQTNITVFAASAYALPAISFLLQQDRLAGVIVPDPGEMTHGANEVSGFLYQLRQANIRFEVCCRENLPLIPSALQAWQSHLAIVITFPHKLPLPLIQSYSLGCYNIHASKLPAYPGPNPIYWQIRHQQQETGVVALRMTEELDAGDIVAVREIPIDPLDTYLCLGNRLAYESSLVVGEIVNKIDESGKALDGITQQKLLKPAFWSRRLNDDDCEVDFDKMTAAEISAVCRAGNGLNNAAVTYYKGVPVNILEATPVDYPTYGTGPGTILMVAEPEGVIVCAGSNSALRLDVLACNDGVFSGRAFAERFQMDAGRQLHASAFTQRKQA